MHEIGEALLLAMKLVGRADPALLQIVGLSVRVSLTATVIAFVLGLPVGGWLAITRWRGRTPMLIIANAALGLPPVVVGLAVYLLLSRSGPLGSLGLLFTPDAMIVAQTVLAFPIVAALAHRILEPLAHAYGDALKVDGASPPRVILTLVGAGRTGLVTVFLSAFGRVIAEVGAILIVGGNIRGVTRTMTTAIALETSTGDLPLALALGFVLIGLSVAISMIAFAAHRAFAGPNG
jgi:tungstate transport system permease protein